MSQTTILHFDDYVLEIIFKNLSISDIAACSASCTRFQKITEIVMKFTDVFDYYNELQYKNLSNDCIEKMNLIGKHIGIYIKTLILDVDVCKPNEMELLIILAWIKTFFSNLKIIFIGINADDHFYKWSKSCFYSNISNYVDNDANRLLIIHSDFVNENLMEIIYNHWPFQEFSFTTDEIIVYEDDNDNKPAAPLNFKGNILTKLKGIEAFTFDCCVDINRKKFTTFCVNNRKTLKILDLLMMSSTNYEEDHTKKCSKLIVKHFKNLEVLSWGYFHSNTFSIDWMIELKNLKSLKIDPNKDKYVDQYEIDKLNKSIYKLATLEHLKYLSINNWNFISTHPDEIQFTNLELLELINCNINDYVLVKFAEMNKNLYKFRITYQKNYYFIKMLLEAINISLNLREINLVMVGDDYVDNNASEKKIVETFRGYFASNTGENRHSKTVILNFEYGRYGKIWKF